MGTHRGNALRKSLLETKPSCRKAFSSLRGKAWMTLILFGALVTIILYAAFYFTGYYMYLGLQERIVSNTRLHTIALIEHRIQQFHVCIAAQRTGQRTKHPHFIHREQPTACSGTWTLTPLLTRSQRIQCATPSLLG